MLFVSFIFCSFPFGRYLVGQLTLATGDDRKAELLFLGVLDAEPTTYGACAAFLSVLHQVRGFVSSYTAVRPSYTASLSFP